MQVSDQIQSSNHEYTPKSPSLRTFPLDSHAHTHLLPPLANTPLGSNPYKIRKADLGSMGNIVELEDSVHETQSMSLNVCKQCQASLMGAFEHCLTRHGEPISVDSVYQIDEEADGQQQTPAPLFDIIKDTSKKEKPMFESSIDKIERDRWVLGQSKKSKETLSITGPRLKGLGVKTGKSFSGAIYKRMLDAKEKEIAHLRGQLYQTMKREEFESVNVQKLRKALNRSVNYYTFAEEWQQSESTRLQMDIKQLKGEISSLMAFLINAEVEKQSVLIFDLASG